MDFVLILLQRYIIKAAKGINIGKGRDGKLFTKRLCAGILSGLRDAFEIALFSFCGYLERKLKWVRKIEILI